MKIKVMEEFIMKIEVMEDLGIWVKPLLFLYSYHLLIHNMLNHLFLQMQSNWLDHKIYIGYIDLYYILIGKRNVLQGSGLFNISIAIAKSIMV